MSVGRSAQIWEEFRQEWRFAQPESMVRGPAGRLPGAHPGEIQFPRESVFLFLLWWRQPHRVPASQAHRRSNPLRSFENNRISSHFNLACFKMPLSILLFTSLEFPRRVIRFTHAQFHRMLELTAAPLLRDFDTNRRSQSVSTDRRVSYAAPSRCPFSCIFW